MSDWTSLFDALPSGEEPDPLAFLLDGLVSEELCEERNYFNLPLCDHVPKPTEWKDEERFQVKLSFDKTEEYIWNIAKSEIETILNNIRRELKCSNGVRPSLQEITSLFFGQSSTLSKIFQENLEVSHRTFMLFMSTFCLAKELSIPISHLYKGRIQTDDLMDYDSYTNLWKKIAAKQEEEDRYTEPFWKEIENAMNSMFKRCVLKGQKKMIIALDDDKRHYDNNSMQPSDGLKQTVHAECRRKGFVAHSAVMPTCGIMVGFTWEQIGDTSTLCYKRIVQNQFGSDLSGILFASDRGYWNTELLFEYLLKSNAEIHGTVKRCPWFPFTYQQKLEVNDRRTLVQVNGMRTLLTKHFKGEFRNITAQAYRNGTGGVALTMSTIFRQKQFDFISDKTHCKWVNRHILPLSTFFRVVNAKNVPGAEELSSDIDEHFFEELGIMVVTPRQGEQSWFISRMFSITSTAAYDHVKFNLAARKSGKFGGILPHWETVRQYLQGNHVEPDQEEEEQITQPNEEQEASINLTSPEQEVNSILEEATNFYMHISEGSDSVNEILKQIGRASNEMIESLYRLMRSNNEGANLPITKKTKDIKAWIQASPEHRPFVWYTVDDLKRRIKEKNGQRRIRAGMKREDLIGILNAINLDPGTAYQSEASFNGTSAIDIVIKTSFMQGLQGKAKKWASLGHQLEPVLAHQLLKHSAEGKTMAAGLKIKQLYRVGLVQKINQPCVKCSLDFFGIGEIDGVTGGFAVEVKARVSGITSQHSRELAQTLGLDEYNPYVQVPHDSPDIKSYIEKESEAIQILHHAFTYNIKYLLLLVGDKMDIISGVLVRFDDSILSAYEQCMKDVEAQALLWAYDRSIPFPRDEIIEAVKKHSYAVDVDTVQTSFELWKSLTDEENLPLPPCHRILPIQAGFWNRVKGGSDVLTRLCNNTKSEPPIKSPQSSVVDRNLTLITAWIHRISQISTANENLDAYSSLDGFCKAANTRSSFSETLHGLVDIFAAWAREPVEKLANEGFQPRRIRRTDRGIIGQKVDWAAKRTGATPKKNTLEKYLDDSPKINAIVYERHQNCPGCPIKRIKSDGERCRARCVICHKTTEWYCIKCRHYACMQPRPDHLGEGVFRSEVGVTDEGVPEEIFGRITCFLHLHQPALDRKNGDYP